MNRITRFISLIMVLVMCLSSFVFVSNAEELPFTDVKAGTWYYSSIYTLYNKGYTNGVSDTLFGVKNKMTRAELVTMLANIAGVTLGDSSTSFFTDVKTNKWYTAAINWAYENQIVSGMSEGMFVPSGFVTREQTYAIIRNFGEYLNYDVTYADDTALLLYHDRNEISSWAKESMAWAVNYGLAKGNDFALTPKSQTTRAEVAVILSSFLDYKNTPPQNPPVICAVTFKNYNGTILYQDYIRSGSTASYRASTPTRPNSATTKFTFTGWDKDLSNITKDTTFTAQYKEEPITYVVTFRNWNGTLLYTSTITIGGTAVYVGATPQKATDANYTYTFKCWDKPLTDIRCDTTFYAQYNAKIRDNRWDCHNDTFGSGLTKNGTNFQMSASLSSRFNTALSNPNVNVAFYCIDLQGGATLGYHANYGFWPGCTVKAGMALTAYKQAEAGAFSFDDKWTYLSKHYCVRSGTIVNSPFGTKFTAREVLYRMIHISDNAAYYMAQDYVGVDNYNKTVQALGVNHTHTSYNSWGTLTPQELGFIWQGIYQYRYQSDYGSALFDQFLNAQFNFIKSALNSKYQVAHKSGWNDEVYFVYNDAGIVFAERPYIVAVMTKYNDGSSFKNTFNTVVKLVDEYMQEYTAYLKNNNLTR